MVHPFFFLGLWDFGGEMGHNVTPPFSNHGSDEWQGVGEFQRDGFRGQSIA